MLYATKDKRAVFTLLLIEKLMLNHKLLEAMVNLGLIQVCTTNLLESSVDQDKFIVSLRILSLLVGHKEITEEL